MSAKDGVILLHGLCRTSLSLKPMARALEREGFIILNVDYPSRTAVVSVLAEEAIGRALANPQLGSCPKIHFVSHSLGGILVRSYFKHRPQGRLGRVVMLGPPNQGSEVVDRLKSWRLFQWLNGPAGVELGTDQDSVPNRLGAATFPLGVVAGDRSINWINSLMIPGPDDGKVSVERTKLLGMTDHRVIHATHPFLMKNPQAIRETISFLKTGAFTAGSGRPAGSRGGLG